MDLTDEQWARLDPLIPEPPRRADGRGRPWTPRRTVLDGVLWILRTGARLTPYEPYLRARWAEGCRNGQQLHREIVAQGFRGTCTLVARFVAQLRRAERIGILVAPITTAGDPLTPHTAAMLLLRRAEQCSDRERAAIEQLRACHLDIAMTMTFTERFVTIVRERRGDALPQWLADAQASAIREIGQFAVKIRKDERAAIAADAPPPVAAIDAVRPDRVIRRGNDGKPQTNHPWKQGYQQRQDRIAEQLE